MKNWQTLLILLLLCINGYAHTDSREKPVFYTFIYSGGDTAVFKNPSDTLLKTINNEITSKVKIIKEAQLTFKNREKIVFKYNSNKLASISHVTVNNRELMVPLKAIHKIPEIIFQTVEVIWDGVEKNPFAASYYLLQFHVGPEKTYNKYPYVQIKFLNQQYQKSLLWKQVNESSLQFSAL